MTEISKSEEEKIDLAKLDGDAYSIFFKKIIKGTNPWYFFKPVVYVISTIVLIFGVMYSWLHFGSKVEEPNKIIPSVIVMPSAPASNIPTSLPSQSVDEGIQEKLRLAQVTIEDLKKENSKLKEDIERKPSYATCIQYGNEISSLSKRKDSIENYILLLLNPQLTQQQINNGYQITPEIAAIYLRQSVEYRKSADDIQKQILAIQELRKPC